MFFNTALKFNALVPCSKTTSGMLKGSNCGKLISGTPLARNGFTVSVALRRHSFKLGSNLLQFGKYEAKNKNNMYITKYIDAVTNNY